MPSRRVDAGLAIGAALVSILLTLPGGVAAHKPITSPFTFAEDVLPIVTARCTPCHAPDGIAPMSLLTHESAVPWAESMRLELVAGHMPPLASLQGAALRRAPALSARELNVLLTWAAGGTPPGEPTTDTPPPPRRTWPMGPPDNTVDLPVANLPAGQASLVRETIVPVPAGRHIVGADILPGNPSVVRQARVILRDRRSSTSHVVSLWVPGDSTGRLPAGAVWSVGADAELVVQVHYKKRWDREKDAADDRSTLGLYFSADPDPARAGAVALVAGPSDRWSSGGASPGGESPLPEHGEVVRRSAAIPRSSRALAVTIERALAGADVIVEVLGASPSDARPARTLAQLTARPGWERRYWMTAPLDFPDGATVRLTARYPAGVTPPATGAPLLTIDTAPIVASRP